jgi:hypothetical protein
MALQADPLPAGHARHSCTNYVDDAADFMAQHQRRFEQPGDLRRAMIDMHIGAADAARSHTNAHFTGSRFRYRQRTNLYRTGSEACFT